MSDIDLDRVASLRQGMRGVDATWTLDRWHRTLAEPNDVHMLREAAKRSMTADDLERQVTGGDLRRPRLERDAMLVLQPEGGWMTSIEFRRVIELADALPNHFDLLAAMQTDVERRTLAFLSRGPRTREELRAVDEDRQRRTQALSRLTMRGVVVLQRHGSGEATGPVRKSDQVARLADGVREPVVQILALMATAACLHASFAAERAIEDLQSTLEATTGDRLELSGKVRGRHRVDLMLGQPTVVRELYELLQARPEESGTVNNVWTDWTLMVGRMYGAHRSDSRGHRLPQPHHVDEGERWQPHPARQVTGSRWEIDVLEPRATRK